MSEIKKFKKGQVVFNEGTWEMTMFSITSGKIGIYANYGTGKEQLLTELEKGKFFGEMGLIEARPRSATAVALEDSELELIDSDNVSDYFRNDPEKIVDILKNMTNRLRRLSADYVDACNTICDYLDTEKSQKKSFWKKIAGSFTMDYASNDLYREMLKSGYDPLAPRGPYWF